MFPDGDRERELGSTCTQGKAQASGGGRAQHSCNCLRRTKLLALLVKMYLHGPRNALILSWAAAGITPSLASLCCAGCTWFVATKKTKNKKTPHWASNYRGAAELLSPFPAPVLSKTDAQSEQDIPQCDPECLPASPSSVVPSPSPRSQQSSVWVPAPGKGTRPWGHTCHEQLPGQRAGSIFKAALMAGRSCVSTVLLVLHCGTERQLTTS